MKTSCLKVTGRQWGQRETQGDIGRQRKTERDRVRQVRHRETEGSKEDKGMQNKTKGDKVDR